MLHVIQFFTFLFLQRLILLREKNMLLSVLRVSVIRHILEGFDLGLLLLISFRIPITCDFL